jgi:hypothetical protein
MLVLRHAKKPDNENKDGRNKESDGNKGTEDI